MSTVETQEESAQPLPLQQQPEAIEGVVQQEGSNERLLVGVRADDGHDFVVDGKGVDVTPSVSKTFKQGAAVRVQKPDSCYPKFDEAAKQLHLTQWQSGLKPAVNAMGRVVGSMLHPAHQEITLLGVRASNGHEYVLSEDGAVLHHEPAEDAVVPQVSAAFPEGARVRITDTDFVYPKMDHVAAQLGLRSWRTGFLPFPPPPVPETPASNRTLVGPLHNHTSRNGSANGHHYYPLHRGAGASNEPAAKRQRIAPPPLSDMFGEVVGSLQHPSKPVVVVGVRTETGKEFLVAEAGLQVAPTDKGAPAGSRVRFAADYVMPRSKERAEALLLSRWMECVQPSVPTGVVLSSQTVQQQQQQQQHQSPPPQIETNEKDEALFNASASEPKKEADTLIVEATH
eukprot:TRINITY_DN377_c0_g1_i1.p1 TRINITY_DN377_c0_g1~~TRINITY_DN377_c0_g1_i1.p1  ORF type:complete len:398 (+),score=63.61 TRINITY_DN377_c0_g1_i1:204-1397(+)